MSAPVADIRHFELKPEYLETPLGRLFVLYIGPRHAVQPLRGVIALPPFAEEMNKSRHMLALLGQSLARAGMLYVLPDLHGTGDSEGDFEQATWEQWTSNVRSVADSLTERDMIGLDVVALRSGAFLIPGLDRSAYPGPQRIVIWNPVQRGAKMIDQLLRSKVIKDSTITNPASVATVRDEIRRAGDMEIAGYRITDDLVSSVDRLELSRLQLPRDSEVHWIDVSPIETDKLPPNFVSVEGAWLGRVKCVSYLRVVGAQFWLGPEIDLVPELISQTTDILVSA
jgi:exosortase A-associated hydrolase 2